MNRLKLLVINVTDIAGATAQQIAQTNDCDSVKTDETHALNGIEPTASARETEHDAIIDAIIAYRPKRETRITSHT